MLAELDRRADPNKEPGVKSIFRYAPLTNAAAHRVADIDVHGSKRPLELFGLKDEVTDRARLRRFSMSRLVHGIAIKTSGGERFAKTEQIFFRADASMSEEHLCMGTGGCGQNSQRRRVCSQHYFVDANSRVDHAG